MALLAAVLRRGLRQRAEARMPASRSGAYKLEVTGARFPPRSRSRRAALMVVRVRNTDSKRRPERRGDGRDRPAEAPVTARSRSGSASTTYRRADPARPVWIVNAGPKGGDTADTNTWALGRLGAGESKTFIWKVTAVRAGDYTIRYRVSPGLNGKAKLASGGRTDGQFRSASTTSRRPRAWTPTATSSAARRPARRSSQRGSRGAMIR